MNYTVKSVGESPREWSSSHGGTFLSYTVDLEAEDGVLERSIEWNKKSSSPAPSVGERVAGRLEESNYGTKFKIDYEATKELGGRRTSSPSGAPKRDVDHSIARQVSLKVLSEKICREEFTPAIREQAERIEQFILEAGQTASQAPGSRADEVGAPPSPGASPASGSSPADDAPQYLQKLLEDACVDRAGSHALSLFIAEKFTLEQRARAEEGLKDPELQGETIAKLKQTYETATGKVVPVDTDGDDIPF